MRTPLVSVRSMLALTGATLAFASCKKVPTAAQVVVAGFSIVQGNNQTAQAGTLLPTPIVLRVVDASDNAIPGIAVQFVVATGGGTVTPSSATSDASGEVSVKWTLGSDALAQTRAGSVGELAPVTVTANALFPSAIVIAQGNNQSGKAGQSLANTVVVRVTGDNSVPLTGIPVQFQVTGGGGAISPQTALTNVYGEVTVKWTLGSVAGPNTALATASTLNPVSLQATATP
jgi:hypothetical protein